MTIDIDKDILKRFKTGKTESTVKTYLFFITKIFKELFNSNTFNTEPLEDIEKVKRYLSKMSTTTYKLITIGLVMLLKAYDADKKLIDVYGKMAKHSREKDLEERVNREATKKEQELFMPWSHVIKIRDNIGTKLNDKRYMNSLSKIEAVRLFQQYFLMCLLTIIPPQRGEVYFNCYTKKTPNANYVDLQESILHIRESKTKRSYGDRMIRLPPKLVSLIKQWQNITNCKNNLLICNISGTKLSTQAYTNMLNVIFGKKVSTDMLRKIYVSHIYEQIKNKSEADKEETKKQLAYILGHSVNVAEAYYDKKAFRR